MNTEFSFCTFVVDDDPFFLQLYHYQLKTLGLKDIYLFDNAKECINSLVLQPDLILLDYYMKPVNGIEALTAIKKYNPDIFVVIVSGQEEIHVPILAMEYGAFDYMVKTDVTEDKLDLIIDKIQAIKKAH